MNRYLSILFSCAFVGWIALPCEALAASITETKAAIGKDCVASGLFSTAMGSETTAAGTCSTAMGVYTDASGMHSIAMGNNTKAQGTCSTAMGHFTTATGNYSTVIGYGWSDGPLLNEAPLSFMVGFMNSPEDTIPELFVKDGSVGIGTKSPWNLLDLGVTKGKKLAVYQNTNGDDFYGLGIQSDTLEIYAGVPSEGVPAMVVKKTTGRIGIGTVSPGYKLEVNGDAAKTSGGTTWINSSDERLKDITGEYGQGLTEIIRLRPITFHYKEGNPRGLPSEDENIGFIAQEVREVFPEAVNEGPDGYLDFNMHPVNVALVNAVKELKVENELLKAENTAMRKDIARIKAALGM